MFDSADFADAELLGQDYDGTQAMTQEAAPGGIDVEGAYEISIAKVFGYEARRRYILNNGHRSRTPTEIAESLVPFVDDPAVFSRIGQMAAEGWLAEDICHKLEDRDRHYDGPRPEQLEPAELKAVTQVLSELKVNLLSTQVGLKLHDGAFWPRPVPGFLGICALIQEARDSGRQLNTATISAGHDRFILKSYELWGVSPPDIMITADTIDLMGLEHTYRPAELAKPSPLLMEITLKIWQQMYGLHPDLDIGNTVLYVGDDPAKDGGFAQNVGASFVLIDKNQPFDSWQQVADQLDLGLIPPEVKGNN
jgi:hypothetical protein